VPQKKKKKAGGVAQGVGPEFKPQNHKKKKRKRKKKSWDLFRSMAECDELECGLHTYVNAAPLSS
jgi:hypothetical protein